MYYRHPVGYEKGAYVTASQIVARFGGSIRLNAVQVGRVFKELGYTNTRTKHGSFWLVVERTTDEIKGILPEPDDPSSPLRLIINDGIFSTPSFYLFHAIKFYLLLFS